MIMETSGPDFGCFSDSFQFGLWEDISGQTQLQFPKFARMTKNREEQVGAKD